MQASVDAAERRPDVATGRGLSTEKPPDWARARTGGYSSDRAYADWMAAAMKKFCADGSCGGCASPYGVASTTGPEGCWH
eukprot:4825479-Heterocapsa_arctica.AAC.1